MQGEKYEDCFKFFCARGRNPFMVYILYKQEREKERGKGGSKCLAVEFGKYRDIFRWRERFLNLDGSPAA